MDTSLDLTAAPREVLLAIIAQQQDAILGVAGYSYDAAGRPSSSCSGGLRLWKERPSLAAPGECLGSSLNRASGPPGRNKNRNPRPRGFARQRMTPAHRVEHVVDNCPGCGTQLSGGWTQRTREVIDLPPVPAQVTEHVYITRVCPGM